MITVQKEFKVSLERGSMYLSVPLGNCVNHCRCIPQDLAHLLPSAGRAEGGGLLGAIGCFEVEGHPWSNERVHPA